MNTAFLLKKLLGALLDPLCMCLFLLVIAQIVLWRRSEKKAALFVFVPCCILIVLGSGPSSHALLHGLERKMPPLAWGVDVEAKLPQVLKEANVRWIAVLGGGVLPEPTAPVEQQLGSDSLARVLEGVRLARLFPSATLIVSGGKVFQEVSEARLMARACAGFGLPEQRIVFEENSLDTADQAAAIAALVGTATTLLVTSANHMPRASALFVKRGISIIPAPTLFLSSAAATKNPFDFLPSSGRLALSQRALHEYLGIAAMFAKQWLE